MRYGRIAIIAGLVSASASIAAQAPGSVESDLRYAREYLEAGNWDYALWRYEEVLRRDPGNAEAKAGHARVRAALDARRGGAAPQAPAQAQAPAPAPAGRRAGCTEIKMPWHSVDPCAAPQPAPEPAPRQPLPVAPPAPAPTAPPAAGGALKVGDYVEFDRFSDGNWGRFGRITRINGDPNSACPSYFVEETGGVTISYVCSRVRLANRPPAPPAPPARPAAGPPVGSYFCTYGVGRGQVLGPGRNFQILPGGQYAADDGERGTYSYSAATGRITFRGGFFGRMNAFGDFIGGRSSQIDINPAGGLLSYCSKQ